MDCSKPRVRWAIGLLKRGGYVAVNENGFTFQHEIIKMALKISKMPIPETNGMPDLPEFHGVYDEETGFQTDAESKPF